MIHVKFEYGENGSLTLRVNGHAGKAEYGQDIVCAAATMLAYTLAQNVSKYRLGLKGRPKIQMKEGDIIIRCRPKDRHRDQLRLVYETIGEGYRLLAHNYPDAMEYAVTPIRD